MSLLPLKTAISDVYPAPDNNTARVGFAALWDAVNEATEKPELDLASAATIDLGGQLSTKLRITGTTGITSFGTTYRGPIFGRFQSSLVLTHNATTLILPGGANLTTSAGGTFIAVPKATTSGTHDGWIVVYASDYFAKAGANTDITSISGVAIGKGGGAISSNTALGANALPANTTGDSNTAVGSGALQANTTGANNTAVGRLALNANLIGTGCTAQGYSALTSSTGNNNTAHGVLAGFSNTTGTNNTMIGANASGASATASNAVTLGDSNVTVLRCQVTSITALSDARDKKDIAPLAAGLDFVQRLKPVSYVWNMRDGGKIGIPDTGFIAQELKQVQIDTGIDIPGLVYEENPERLEAAYGKLLPVMVKAIQELSAEVEALKRIVNNC